MAILATPCVVKLAQIRVYSFKLPHGLKARQHWVQMRLKCQTILSCLFRNFHILHPMTTFYCSDFSTSYKIWFHIKDFSF